MIMTILRKFVATHGTSNWYKRLVLERGTLKSDDEDVEMISFLFFIGI